MKKEYIEVGGKKYRVEANWNAVAEFCAKKGAVKLSQLDILSRLGVGDILTLMHCCIKEGERMDGRDFELTEQDLGSVANAGVISRFIALYVAQSQLGGGSEAGGKK